MITKVLTMTKQRNFLVIVNTAIAAGASVVLLLGAARSMGPQQLSNFSLVQLIIMTAVMLQRALFLSPALASQRRHGKSHIPVLWSVQLSLPCSLVIGVFLAWTMAGQGKSYAEWLLLSVGASAVVLVQDMVRFSLLSRELVHGAVVSDALWLALIVMTVFLNGYFETAYSLTLYWSATGLLAILVGLIFLYSRRDSQSQKKVSIRQTWRLGKWSGLDAFMSAAANLAPMLMTTLVIGSENAGTYRVLQSSLGPLNILSTSLITMLGLDAWKYVSAESLSGLQRTVRRAMAYMIAFAVAYIALAEVAVIVISGLASTELIRIAIVVGLVGILGAATAPLSAASLALGYQKDGAILRVIIVAFSLTTSSLAGLGYWLPWNDPIGTVTLFAAITGLLGWSLSYRRAMSIERRTETLRQGHNGVGRHFTYKSAPDRR